MQDHCLTLNFGKTELPVFLKQTNPFIITFTSKLAPCVLLLPSLFVILASSHHLPSVSWLSRFALFNIKKSGYPSIPPGAGTMVISCIDHCNTVLKGTPMCMKPLQMVQNAAAPLVFNHPKWAHTIPLLKELHWLPVASHFKFNSLILTNRVRAGSALSYLNNLVWPHATPHSLRSSHDPGKQSVRAQSKLFSYLFHQCWNNLSSSGREGEKSPTFKKVLKTQLFLEHLLS